MWWPPRRSTLGPVCACTVRRKCSLRFWRACASRQSEHSSCPRVCPTEQCPDGARRPRARVSSHAGPRRTARPQWYKPPWSVNGVDGDTHQALPSVGLRYGLSRTGRGPGHWSSEARPIDVREGRHPCLINDRRSGATTSTAGDLTNLDRHRPVLLVDLQEPLGPLQCLRLVLGLKDRVPAHDLLALGEGS